jgi:hypothetical protein
VSVAVFWEKFATVTDRRYKVGLTVFAVSNFRIDESIRAACTKNEPSRGDKTAARANRLIQSRPQYIAA